MSLPLSLILFKERSSFMSSVNEEGVQERPFGLPRKEGTERLTNEAWAQISDFISSRKWLLEEPALKSDLDDPLLAKLPTYGAFMMGFDFHLSPDGPKIIEVNTNAGGLATVFTFSKLDFAKSAVRSGFISSILKEYELFQCEKGTNEPLQSIAIVDDNVSSQGLYPEMLYFAELLRGKGIKAIVCSPEDLRFNEETSEIFHGEVKIDLIYNRMTDFRLEEPNHQGIRKATIKKTLALTPHPAVYVRAADKRNLMKMKHVVIPETHLLKDKSVDEWAKIKKDYVFKPPAGNASKGVYRGDKISVAKLQTLDSETIVQKFVPPAVSEDESKFDVRVYTRDADIIGLASRHFTGQVMEMRSSKSGFKEVLPDGVCCLPCLDLNKCAELLKTWTEERNKISVDLQNHTNLLSKISESLKSAKSSTSELKNLNDLLKELIERVSTKSIQSIDMTVLSQILRNWIGTRSVEDLKEVDLKRASEFLERILNEESGAGSKLVSCGCLDTSAASEGPHSCGGSCSCSVNV